MNTLRSILALFLIAGYTLVMTNNLIPRCQNETEHKQHLITHLSKHFHNGDRKIAQSNHIGHQKIEIDNLCKYLHNLLDDAENPKDNCESGLFVNVINQTIDKKIVLLNLPFDFNTLIQTQPTYQKDYFQYLPTYITTSESYWNPLRGPPTFYV